MCETRTRAMLSRGSAAGFGLEDSGQASVVRAPMSS